MTEVTITSMYDRPEGTFLNPPPSSTAEHCLWFWSNVAIPDEIVVAFLGAWPLAYNKRRDEYLTPFYKAWWSETKAMHPNFTDEQLQAGWQAHRDEQQMIEQWEKQNPSVKRFEVAQVIRALMMTLWSPDPEVFPEEAQKVLDHHIEICSGHYPVSYIVERYDLAEHRDMMRSIPSQPVHQTTRVSDTPLLKAIKELTATTDHWGGALSDSAIDLKRGQMTTSY